METCFPFRNQRLDSAYFLKRYVSRLLRVAVIVISLYLSESSLLSRRRKLLIGLLWFDTTFVRCLPYFNFETKVNKVCRSWCWRQLWFYVYILCYVFLDGFFDDWNGKVQKETRKSITSNQGKFLQVSQREMERQGVDERYLPPLQRNLQVSQNLRLQELRPSNVRMIVTLLIVRSNVSFNLSDLAFNTLDLNFLSQISILTNRFLKWTRL